MKNARMSKNSVALVLVLLLAGCALIGQGLKTPEVSLVDIRLQQVKILEATFGIDLRVLNPNATALELSGLDCDIEINGQHFARGVAPVASRVEPYGTVIVPLEVYASLPDMAGVLIDTLRRAESKAAAEPIRYRIKGSVGLKAGRFSNPSLAFENRGEIDLHRAARP